MRRKVGWRIRGSAQPMATGFRPIRGASVARVLLVWTVVAAAGCQSTPSPVVYRSDHDFSRAERQAIESISRSTVREVRGLLPDLPRTFGLFVNTGDRVIPETGETGSVSLPSGVYWTIDPNHAGGVLAIVNAQLRPTLFHELYHMVRETQLPPRTLIDRAISEGLATVFERDFGAGSTPWGDYPPDVRQWVAEFLALPADSDRRRWMIEHTDGRRWIGFKVGTYLVERAIQRSGEPVSRLATVPTEQIVAWALES